MKSLIVYPSCMECEYRKFSWFVGDKYDEDGISYEACIHRDICMRIQGESSLGGSNDKS